MGQYISFPAIHLKYTFQEKHPTPYTTYLNHATWRFADFGAVLLGEGGGVVNRRVPRSNTSTGYFDGVFRVKAV